MKRRLILGLLALLILLGFTLRHFTNRDLKDLVERVERAIESADLDACMAVISTDYTDRYGHTAADLRVIAQRFFESVEGVNVIIVGMTIERGDQRAVLSMQVKLVGAVRGYPAYLLGGIADTSPVTIHLMKKRHQWLVIEIDNQELGSQRGAR